MTILACASASGYSIPPMVVFDRKHLQMDMTRNEVPGTFYRLSNSGWMDAELFEEWFKESSDPRYALWLETFYPQTTAARDGVLEVLLKRPTPPAQYTVKSNPMCSCVLTSDQCIQEMEEKQEANSRKIEEKEEKRRVRKRKKEEKEIARASKEKEKEIARPSKKKEKGGCTSIKEEGTR